MNGYDAESFDAYWGLLMPPKLRPHSASSRNFCSEPDSPEPVRNRRYASDAIHDVTIFWKGDLPAFFGPVITGEQRQLKFVVRLRVLPGQREPALPASALRHPSQPWAQIWGASRIDDNVWVANS